MIEDFLGEVIHMNTSWREEITRVMIANEDKDINNYICTLTEAELDIEFDDDFGGVEGLPFYLLDYLVGLFSDML